MRSRPNFVVRKCSSIALLFAIAGGHLISAGKLNAQAADALWNMDELGSPPATEPADPFGATDIQAVFFDGEPLACKPTKVYAYLGLPNEAKFTAPFPGIVCVHGGGGTAYAEWVRIWNQRGFAAIALDTNGSIPKVLDGEPDRYRHERAGPPRYGFDQGNTPPRDQWPYHAVSATIRANSLLRSLPEVDSSKVGITGISWGGYLTCLVAGIDPRFKFAIPVYGCGFLDEGPTWSKSIDDYGHDRWMRLWDPSSYLSHAKCPMLWVNGTNDRHYYLPMFQQSYRLPTGQRTLAIRVRMDHGHGSGWSPPEMYAFAESVVGKGQPLATITRQSATDRFATVHFHAPAGITIESGELVYTTDRGDWYDRNWKTATAQVDEAKSQVSSELPAEVAVYFFNLRDSRGLLVSSEHMIVPPASDVPAEAP